MANANYDILHYIAEYRAKGVSQSFEDLLTNTINIAEGIRTIASASQENLRGFLVDECKGDAGFPRVLRTSDRDFLGGSFARHTKNRPLDDIDIYLPLDGANLFYHEHGAILPYTVLSDGSAWNPLLTSRWAVGAYVSSAKLIDGFAAVLRRRFPRTEVRPNGQAVSIRMTHGATQDKDGLGYDVVPCFSLKPNRAGDSHFYLMPDGRNGWMRTNPRIDAARADMMQERHNKLFRKVVKVLKYWNAEFLGGALASYFVELAIARAFWERAAGAVGPLSHGVALGFWAIRQAVNKGSLASWVDNAPPVYPGALLAVRLNTLMSDTDLACAAWEDEKAGSNASSAAKWKRVFGNKFPD